MSRLGVFGGTFNPPHLGHRHLALTAKEAAELDEIIVIPDNIPPHKESGFLASGEDRIELCRRVFVEEFFTVSDIELCMEGKSYSLLTLQKLKGIFPGDELVLIIGSDMLMSFHTWYNYEEILKLCTLCCLSRAEQIAPYELFSYAQNTLKLSKSEIIIADVPPFELSSTEIRRRFLCGEETKGMLTDAQREYIQSRGLYKC